MSQITCLNIYFYGTTTKKKLKHCFEGREKRSRAEMEIRFSLNGQTMLRTLKTRLHSSRARACIVYIVSGFKKQLHYFICQKVEMLSLHPLDQLFSLPRRASIHYQASTAEKWAKSNSHKTCSD